MHIPTIYDPSGDDTLGTLRGGGRIVKILRENIGEHARFVTNLSHVSHDDTLLIPLWRPFKKPLLSRRIAQKQILMLFDAIPLKYPQHFPVGIKGRWWLFQNTRSLGIYDEIVTISEAAKDDIVEYLGFDADRIHVIYPTSSAVFFDKKSKRKQISQSYSLPKGPFSVYVGDTNWNKNLPTLAQAIIKADIKAVFVGKAFTVINDLRTKDAEDVQDFFATDEVINHPEQRDFKNFVKLTLHDDEHFYFPGYIPDEDMIHLFKKATCNMLVSREEGFGLSYLEAASQGCPSVLSDIPVFREVAGSAALYANPENSNDIAKAIKSMHKKRDAVGAAALKRSQRYVPATFASGLLKVLA